MQDLLYNFLVNNSLINCLHSLITSKDLPISNGRWVFCIFLWMGQQKQKYEFPDGHIPEVSLLCSPGSGISTNMETWPTTVNEVIREQGPPADLNSSLTFSRHHPLLTPQLTSSSAPLLEEQRGRFTPHPPPPPPFPFYLYFLLSFSAWIHPGPQEITILFH